MAPNTQFSKLELMQGRVKFIPDNWDFVHLKKAYKICNNLRLPISEEERLQKSGVYPYYGPTKIQGYISDYQQDGDYALIGEDGDHFLKYRSMPMTQLVSGKCTVNNHAHVIQGTKKATREWFYYYFMHRDIFSFLSRQGAGRYKLNKAALEQLPILIPPLNEQQKIAQILSTWDKAIEKLEALITVKQKRKKALMQQILTGKKRFSGFEESWKQVSLGSFFVEHQQKSTVNNQYPVVTSSRRGIFLQEDYFKKQVASEDNIGYKIINYGDFTFRSMSDDGVFVFNRQDIIQKAIISPAYGVFIVMSGCPDYFYFFLNSELMLFEIGRLGQGGTRTALKFSALKNLTVKIPPFEEQQKIASVLSSVDTEIEIHQKQLAALKEQKKGLMQQLLTGKLRVKLEKEH